MDIRITGKVAAALLVLSVTFCVIGSCTGRREVSEEDSDIVVKSDSAIRAANDITKELWLRAYSTTAGMDTLQLIGQLFMPAVYASNDYWTVRQVSEYAEDGIGGIVLLKGDCEGARALADTMTRAGKIRPFISIDAEWGLNMRLADAPEFPANGKISPEVSDQLMYDYGREVARECNLVGINMVLGPVLDVSAKHNGFLGKRSFGGDPDRVAELGLAYGRGLEDGNVISVAKHFPGHGSVTQDSHKQKGLIDGSLQRLDSVDLLPFRRWIESGLSGVMVGHLAVPSIDSKMYPAAVSKTVINDLLREDLGFRGLVITDAMNMLGAEGYGADMAIKAGADIIVAPADTHREIERVLQSLRDGSLGMENVREKVRRILFYKYLIEDDTNVTLKEYHLDNEDVRKLQKELGGE